VPLASYLSYWSIVTQSLARHDPSANYAAAFSSRPKLVPTDGVYLVRMNEIG
jgi:hypothetical protein